MLKRKTALVRGAIVMKRISESGYEMLVIGRYKRSLSKNQRMPLPNQVMEK